MELNSDQLHKYIAEDVKKYKGIRRPLKAGVLERQTVNKMRLTKLHPNPEDEFTWPKVGPKDSIVGKYMTDIRKHAHLEPLYVEKMFPDGYTILNGHHRWAAGMRVGLDKMPVKIVNMTKEADILKQIDQSKRRRRASFDLDEVLMCTDFAAQDVAELRFPYNKLCKGRLRSGVPALIRELHRLGFDVWVYTHTATAEEQVRMMFRGYGDEPDIYINGVGWKQKHNTPIEVFNGKYNLTVHIDNESMIFTRPKSKEFDEVELNSGGRDWALNVMREIEVRSDPDYVFQ